MMQLLINNPALRWALLLLLFIAVALASYAVAGLAGDRGVARRRLAGPAGAAVLDGTTIVAGTLRSDTTQGMWV